MVTKNQHGEVEQSRRRSERRKESKAK